eukprot:403343408
METSTTPQLTQESIDIASRNPLITLNNGQKMPQVGFGTFKADEGENIEQLIKDAVLKYGYRHIDTAKVYFNEEKIGCALKECITVGGVKREELFITTKLYHDADKQNVEVACRAQLAKLQLEYLDLYLVHWMAPYIDWNAENPVQQTPAHEVWAQMERLVDLGLVKSIGVCNCSSPMMLDLLTYAKIKPVVNQIELHPYLMQKEYVDFIRNKFNIHVTAYAPLGAANWTFKKPEYNDKNLLKEPIITELAAKYEKSVGTIILNWHTTHRGHIVIPKTSKEGRLRENIDIFDFKLTEEEYAQIDMLNCGARFYDPLYFSYGIWKNWPYFS